MTPPTPTPSTTASFVSAPAGTTSAGIDAHVELQIAEAMASMAHMPAALVGALKERFFQMTDHHRRSALKHVKATAPGGLKTMRMLASRLYRYGSKRGAGGIGELAGESFAASTSREGPVDRRALALLETGGRVNAKEYMAIPVGAGVRKLFGRVVPTKQFVDFLKNKRFQIVNTPKVKGLLVAVFDERTSTNRRTKEKERLGTRSVVLGKLIKARTQRPLLGFYDRFDAVMPKHLAAIDADVTLAMSVAGRQKLRARIDTKNAEREAYRTAFQAGIREVKDLTGKDAAKVYAAARASAKKAAAMVRSANRVGEARP